MKLKSPSLNFLALKKSENISLIGANFYPTAINLTQNSFDIFQSSCIWEHLHKLLYQVYL